MKYYLTNIKKRRLELGLNQEQVSEKLHCNYSTYGKMENGQIALTVDRLLEISKILNISIFDLLNDKKIATEKLSKKIKILVELELSAEEFAKTGLDKKLPM